MTEPVMKGILADLEKLSEDQ